MGNSMGWENALISLDAFTLGKTGALPKNIK